MSAIPKFTKAHAILLNRFLTSPQRPKGTMTYPQLAGFVFSVACAPDLIPPSEWLPIVFDDQEAKYKTLAEAEKILQAIMALYNDCRRQGLDGRTTLPPGCEIRSKPLDNLKPDAPLSQWAKGFPAGHDWLEELWSQYTPESLGQEMDAVLMALTFFSFPSLAEAYHKEGKGKPSLGQLAEKVVKIFPDALVEYAHLGQAIFQARQEEGDFGPDPSDHPEVG